MRLQAEVDRQTAVIGILEDQIERLFDLLASSNEERSTLLDAHRSLLEAHERVQKRLDESTALVPAPRMVGNVPMHIPEYEEDARIALENGDIDKEMFNNILREAGFENTEIDLEP